MAEEQKVDYSKLSTDELIKLDKEYEAEAQRLQSLQMALKIVLNSGYGAMGNNGFRYFNLYLASSITTSGQLAIRWIERKLNEFLDKKTGFKKDRVVLIDTDSVMLDLEDVVNLYCPKEASQEQKLEFLNQLAKKVLDPYIDKSYRELADYTNAYAHKFHMKRENIVSSMISVAAKSYLCRVWDSEGVRYSIDNPHNKIMGLQMVKSSTPKVVQDAMKNAIPILTEQTESDLQDYIVETRKKFNKLSVEEIAFPRGVTEVTKFNKKLVEEKLKKTSDNNERAKLEDMLQTKSTIYTKYAPAHVKAALIYNELIDRFGLNQQRQKIVGGDKIKFVYLTTPNPINEDCIGFQDTLPKEFGLHDYVDYERMFEKTFIEPISKITTALNWKTKKESFLDDFFDFGQKEYGRRWFLEQNKKGD